MADEKIILAGKISINAGEAEKSVKSAQSELKNLKKQLATMSEGDDGFDELTKKAAKLQDKIGDVNTRIKALASDTRSFDAIVGGVETAVGAFTAAQGAVALFSGENENLNKIIVKVQGSMALLNGVQALAKNLNKDSAMMVGLHNAAQRLFGVTLTTNIGILKLFTAALIGTGIGALAVVVGAIITQWDKLNERFKDSIPFLSKIGEILEELPEIWTKISAGIVEGLIRIGQLIGNIWDRDWKALKENAANFSRNIVKAANDAAFEEQQKANIKAREQEELDEIEWRKKKQAQYDERIKLALKHYSEMADKSRAFRDLEEKYDNEYFQRELKRREEAYQPQRLNIIPDRDSEEDIAALAAEEELQAKLAAIRKRYDDEKTKAKQDEINLERATTDAKLAIAANGFALVNQLFHAFGAENSAAAKAFALAAIAADTARAITGAIAGAQGLPFPANLAATATSIAAVTSAIAQATRILSSDVPMPNIAANMPTTSMGVPATFGAFNLQGSAPNISPITPSSTAPKSQRVYVLEDDIRSTTNRVNKNNQRGYVR